MTGRICLGSKQTIHAGSRSGQSFGVASDPSPVSSRDAKMKELGNTSSNLSCAVSFFFTSESHDHAQSPEKRRPTKPLSILCGVFEEDEEERLKAILQELELRRHRRINSVNTRRTASTPVSVAGHIPVSQGVTTDTNAWVDGHPLERCASLDAAHP